MQIAPWHLDAIPTAEIRDITQLTAKHASLVRRMLDVSLGILHNQELRLPAGRKLEDVVITGYLPNTISAERLGGACIAKLESYTALIEGRVQRSE